MRYQRAFSGRQGLMKCGLTPIPNTDAHIAVFKDNKDKISASFGGCMTCDNNLCPNCSIGLVKERNQVISNTLTEAKRLGYITYFPTITINKVGSLSRRQKALNFVFNKVIARDAKAYCKRKGVQVYEYCKGHDLTINLKNKDVFHPHLHSILIIDKEVEGLVPYIWKRIRKIMKDLGFSLSKLGFKMPIIKTLEGIQSYINKTYQSMAYEITSTKKQGKGDGLSFFISKEAANPTPRGIAIYKEVVRETKGLRWYSQSRGFKAIGETHMSNEVKEDNEKEEIFRQDITINLWYAINEVENVKPLLKDLLIIKFENPDCYHMEWEEFMILVEKSKYDTKCSHSKIDFYKRRLTDILGERLSEIKKIITKTD
jgi:hypothetical protein